MVKVKRGDIWLAALNPTVGAEIQKTRFCVIVSPPEIHDWLRTVLNSITGRTTLGRTSANAARALDLTQSNSQPEAKPDNVTMKTN